MLAAGLAWQHQVFDLGILLLCLITAILLQIISNLANDYGDAITGADDEQRIAQRIGAEKNPRETDEDEHAELLRQPGHSLAVKSEPLQFTAIQPSARSYR